MWSSGKNLNDGCLCKLLTVKLQMRYYTQKVAFALAAAAVLSVLLAQVFVIVVLRFSLLADHNTD